MITLTMTWESYIAARAGLQCAMAGLPVESETRASYQAAYDALVNNLDTAMDFGNVELSSLLKRQAS